MGVFLDGAGTRSHGCHDPGSPVCHCNVHLGREHRAMMDSKHPGTKIVYQFSLEEYIPKDHFLRLVDSRVDFSFVRDVVRRFYSDLGAPSVDPVVKFTPAMRFYRYSSSYAGRSRSFRQQPPIEL